MQEKVNIQFTINTQLLDSPLFACHHLVTSSVSTMSAIVSTFLTTPAQLSLQRLLSKLSKTLKLWANLTQTVFKV